MDTAQTLLGMLPLELTTLGEPEERATEYHYRQFFMIWETPEWVVQYRAIDVLGMGKEARAGWLADYRVNLGIIMMLFIWWILMCEHCRWLSTMCKIKLRSC